MGDLYTPTLDNKPFKNVFGNFVNNIEGPGMSDIFPTTLHVLESLLAHHAELDRRSNHAQLPPPESKRLMLEQIRQSDKFKNSTQKVESYHDKNSIEKQQESSTQENSDASGVFKYKFTPSDFALGEPYVVTGRQILVKNPWASWNLGEDKGDPNFNNWILLQWSYYHLLEPDLLSVISVRIRKDDPEGIYDKAVRVVLKAKRDAVPVRVLLTLREDLLE